MCKSNYNFFILVTYNKVYKFMFEKLFFNFQNIPREIGKNKTTETS